MMPVILLIITAYCIPSTAYAYLDPGTGSLLLQGTISMLAALFVSITLGWNYVVGAIRKCFTRGGASKAPADPTQDDQ